MVIWQYCADSVKYIFESSKPSPEREHIVEWLLEHGPAMKSEIYTDCFGHHRKAASLDDDLDALVKAGKVKTGGDLNSTQYYVPAQKDETDLR
jgi:hypothetical protein